MDNDLVTSRLQNMTFGDKNVQNPTTQGPTDLYEHLSKLLPELASFQQDKIDPITNLEYISEYMKKYQFQPTTPPTQEQVQLWNYAAFDDPQPEDTVPTVVGAATCLAGGTEQGERERAGERSVDSELRPAE